MEVLINLDTGLRFHPLLTVGVERGGMIIVTVMMTGTAKGAGKHGGLPGVEVVAMKRMKGREVVKVDAGMKTKFSQKIKGEIEYSTVVQVQVCPMQVRLQMTTQEVVKVGVAV